MLRSASKLALLGLIATFAGCVTTGSRDLPELSDWETRSKVLQQVDEWEFSGRIGVSAGDEGFNGKLWWRQDGVVFRARLAGPLGAGTVFINGANHELTVTDGDGQITELDDAETELRAMYGWTIPVTSLRFWALGVADPATPAETEIDDSGRLTHLQQRNWQVDITQYREHAGQFLPRRLTAVNDDVKVRLIIDKWAFR